MSDEPAAVRLYAESDHEHVIALAGRLAVGVASWRSTTAAVHAAHQWTAASTSRAPDEGAAFVAERRRSVVGFVSVSTRLHFTGAVDAYIGELVVADTAARTGVGRQLVAAAEAWARDRGLERIYLQTGAANVPARRFYTALGFQEEEVALSKQL